MKYCLHVLFCAVMFFVCACEEPNTPSGPTGPSDPPTITIQEDIPTANFGYKIQQPLSVAFVDESSGEPTKRTWDFGDGSTSSQTNPTHRYSQTGTYIVTLTVSNSAGSDTKRISITIPTPKVYVNGVKYLKVGKESMYYRAVCKDDDFFTTTWWSTNYTSLLYNVQLPYSYIFASPVEMSGLNEDDYYYVFVYWNTKTNGDGTQILKQQMFTAAIQQYPAEIILTNNNKDTQVSVLFDYK